MNNILNMLFLSIGASALCFVTWNYAVKNLGELKTSIYIYIVPVVTVIAAAVILKEQLTISAIIGAVLTLMGLFVSQTKLTIFKRKSNKRSNSNEH
ncbi:MAG: DMT family transporter [Acetobacter sp.]|nr:DMT family transporter [Bacteroides sp.]MCM1340253.1 DMT family transporter [Acetobacter sp.]